MNSISSNLNIMIKASEKASKILIRDYGEMVSVHGAMGKVFNPCRVGNPDIIQFAL